MVAETLSGLINQIMYGKSYDPTYPHEAEVNAWFRSTEIKDLVIVLIAVITLPAVM